MMRVPGLRSHLRICHIQAISDMPLIYICARRQHFTLVALKSTYHEVANMSVTVSTKREVMMDMIFKESNESDNLTNFINPLIVL